MDFVNWLLTATNGMDYLVYFMVFFFAGMEATIGMSMLFPGSLSVMIIGALSAMSTSFKIYYILPFAIIGAILGDNISYFLGNKYGSRLIERIKFIDEQTLSSAKRFIDLHGPKSVMLGRFVPFIKETMPFVAGSFNMNRMEFIKFNIIGAIGWGILWPGMGYVFAKSILAGNSVATKIQLILMLLIFAYLAYFFLKDFVFERYKIDIVSNISAILNNKLWRMFIISSVVLYSFFVLLTIEILEHDALVELMDYMGFLYIYSNFNEAIFGFMKLLTLTAKWYVVLFFLICLSVFFFFKKITVYTLPFWISIGGVSVSVLILKHIVGRTRPEYMRVTEHGMSFPSGHAALATVVAGVIIYVLLKNEHIKHKTFWISAACIWAVLIYISRIYLGVHYISDIVGGILLGLVFVVMGGAVYNWIEHRYNK